jgi:hypothetical protein
MWAGFASEQEPVAGSCRDGKERTGSIKGGGSIFGRGETDNEST